MFLRLFKEPARIVSAFFEAFSGVFILLELEMASFLPIIFKMFFRGAGFDHFLRMFFFFFFFFLKSEKKGQWHFIGPLYYQEILFNQNQCSLPLSQLIPVVRSYYSL